MMMAHLKDVLDTGLDAEHFGVPCIPMLGG
jgi:hypothetical protein